MFNGKRLFKSFTYALRGLSYVWRNEQNFRIQSVIALFVFIAMPIFQVTIGEAIILSMLIIFVLVLELANTVAEKIVDILKPRMHAYVEVIKDMMAAAVFIASIGSTVVAFLIFVPHVIDLIVKISG